MISTVQVIYSLAIGGAEKLAVTVGTHLDRNKFRAAVCALDGDGVLAEELVRERIPHHILWRKGIEAGVLARLYRCFRLEKARIVHTHQFTQLLFSLAPAWLCGAKVVHTEHEFYLYRDHARSRRLFRHLAPFCSALTVVGPDIASYYIDLLGIRRERIHVIANSVDLEQFIVEPDQARHRFGFSADEVVFGIVGRLEPEKDHRTLLQAFRAVINNGKAAARLLIVGDGSLRRELESYTRCLGLERHVVFLGERTDIPDVLAALDVFVLSSLHEGVPLSVIEGMAAGKPVIATDVGGMRLLVKSSINGLLVPAGDPGALEAAMANLASNPLLRHEFGARGRQIARESFSVSSMISRYQEIYEAVLNNRNVRN